MAAVVVRPINSPRRFSKCTAGGAEAELGVGLDERAQVVERRAKVAGRAGGVVEVRAAGCFAGEVGDDAPAGGWLAVGLDGVRVADGDDELAFVEGGGVAEFDGGEAVGGDGFWRGTRSLKRARLWVDGEDGEAAAGVGGADCGGVCCAVDRGDGVLVALVDGQVVRQHESRAVDDYAGADGERGDWAGSIVAKLDEDVA